MVNRIGDVIVEYKELYREFAFNPRNQTVNYFMEIVKAEFAEKFNLANELERIVMRKESGENYVKIWALANQFDKCIFITEYPKIIDILESESLQYQGSKPTGHYAGIKLSVNRIDTPNSIIVRNQLMNGTCGKHINEVFDFVQEADSIIETIIGCAKFNGFAGLEFTIHDIDNIAHARSTHKILASVKCLQDMFGQEVIKWINPA
jgi:hypothetical protein